jgi:hypothetical protein
VVIPPFDSFGDLPVGIHQATLAEVMGRFGTGTGQRKVVASRLDRVCRVAWATGHVARLVVFGSFVTTKPDPNDVDVFLLMDDAFDSGRLRGETQLLFDHTTAQAHYGASVFWMRRIAALGGEQAAIENWQIKRGGGERGIVEIVLEAP